MFIFMAVVWWIWRARNALCFAGDLLSLYSLKMRIVDYALLLKNGSYNLHDLSIPQLVRWNTHDRTGMILNVDGSSIGNHGISGYGGLLRTANGAWVHGFFGNLRVTHILHAELMTIYKGLLLAWERDIKELWCYSDSRNAITLIIESVDEWHHYAAIINNIKDNMNRDWQVSLLHTLREGNTCADFLAKLGATSNEAFSSIAIPPVGLNLSLLADASGTWFPR
jgi:ribonuclease HI